MRQPKHDCVSRNTSQQAATGRSVISACLEDVRRAQSYLAAAASLLRGVATAAPSMTQSLSDTATAVSVICRSLDADVLALRDLSDNRWGVR